MRKKRILYTVWLVVLATLLVACSLEYWSIPALGTVQTTCFLLFVMTDLLCILLVLTGYRSFWEAIRRLLLFGGATALYAVYCFCLNDLPHTGKTTDALAAGALLCVAAVFSDGRQFSESPEGR
ncbi:MAG: hypothetical protein LUD16_06085 [Lachnospiraceae bacterium]|nr:hypothetical protein [Lachnospiraceae bacterium]